MKGIVRIWSLSWGETQVLKMGRISHGSWENIREAGIPCIQLERYDRLCMALVYFAKVFSRGEHRLKEK